MSRRFPAALALLVLLLPSIPAALVQARVVPEVSAGGGWASDLFAGAGFGEHGQTSIAPGLGADLSTGPVVKLLSRYRYTLSRYLHLGEDAGSQGHDLELTTRLRLGRGFDLDVPVSAGYLMLDETAPVEADLPAAVALGWLEAGPCLRYQLERGSRVEAGATLRASKLRVGGDDDWVGERALTVFAGASRRFGQRFEAALRYDHAATGSDFAGHDRASDGIVAVLAVAPWGELVTRASAGLEDVRYPAFRVAADAERRREDLRRVLGLSASHPLGDHVELEASVAWTRNANNLDVAEGDRWSTWLGLRAQLPYWL